MKINSVEMTYVEWRHNIKRFRTIVRMGRQWLNCRFYGRLLPGTGALLSEKLELISFRMEDYLIDRHFEA